ncbi:Wadjet anti-phage system protein JetD domain-containing protein [Ruminococcus bicirculans (ex Wegman et al. 2014)]|uniref:Wadjet anti-phage system protein JetD domain-containing protein n=1 Tax=Ruminococcus bicirculans (ex Wegman et al. 2014) TaxID=1160721 RepID=UPI003670C3BD
MNYQSRILNELIDKYENSKHYSDGTAFTKRVIIYCRDLIDVTDHDLNAQFISDVSELKERKFVDCDWVRKDLVVDRIWLILDNVNDIYAFLGRKSRNDTVNEVLEEIERLSENIITDWIKEYLISQYELIREKNKLIGIWKSDIKLIREILSALREIDRLNGKTVSMRTFSINLYSDSKYFERNIKKYIADIAGKYEPDLREAEELSEREILQQLGIVMMPEIFEFCGDLIIKFKNGAVDFSPIRNGSCISGDCVEDIQSAEIKGVSRIIFIENKTNYSEYCLKSRNSDELVIFHGGFYSPQRGAFFKTIYNAAANIPIYFWADIDYGGFKMFARLKNNIIPGLQPMNMSVEAHKNHSHRLLERSDEYIEKLLKLCNDENYSEFYDVIQAIADSHGTVEQECFLLDDNVMLV